MLKPTWSPETNTVDMVKQEINDVTKQLQYVKSLEAKLEGKDPNGTEFQNEFETLSKFKKDLGLPVDFKTATEKREEQRAKDAGYVAPDPKAPPKNPNLFG